MQVGHLLGGSVLVETVFGWPGLGRLVFDALLQRDINLLLGILFVSSVVVVLANLVVDLVYGWLDPRIVHGEMMAGLRDFWRVYRQNRGAVVGLVVLVLVLVAALVGPMLYPVDPFDMVGRPIREPFGEFLLGTERLGRDIAAGLLHGARVSLLDRRDRDRWSRRSSASLVGALAGYYGGRIDDLLMRATEFFLTIPSFVLAVVLVAIFSPSHRQPSSAAIAAVSWPSVARLTRAEFMASAIASTCWRAARWACRTGSIILRRSCRMRCRRRSWSSLARWSRPRSSPSPGCRSSAWATPTTISWGYMIGVGAHRAAARLVDDGDPRRDDPGHGARDQPRRRRPERRPQPAAEGPMSAVLAVEDLSVEFRTLRGDGARRSTTSRSAVNEGETVAHRRRVRLRQEHDRARRAAPHPRAAGRITGGASSSRHGSSGARPTRDMRAVRGRASP